MPPQPQLLERDEELPSNELFYLRTGIVIDGTRSSRLVVDANAPHGVLSSLWDSPWLQWKRPSPANLLEASRTFSDLLHSPQDQAAVQRALCMARLCPTGVVTLTVRNAPALSQEWPRVFLSLRITSSEEICVNACALRKGQRAGRLEPCLHTEWRAETKHTAGDSTPRPCFAVNYDSDDDTNNSGNSQDGPAHQHRHPLELLATQLFLAEDLVRRAGAGAPNLGSPDRSRSCLSDTDSSPRAQSPKSPSHSLMYMYM